MSCPPLPPYIIAMITKVSDVNDAKVVNNQELGVRNQKLFSSYKKKSFFRYFK